MGILFGDSVAGVSIKSIQSGTVELGIADTSNTAALTPTVDTDNAFVIFNGSKTDEAGEGNHHMNNATVGLTNSNTVTAARYASGTTLTIAFTVIEFNADVVKSIQKSTILIPNGSLSAGSIIAAVDQNRAAVFYGGFYTSIGYQDNFRVYLELTSSTTVTAYRNTSDELGPIVAYTVVEFNSI